MDSVDTEPCPLSSAMVELLQTAADHSTVRDMELAERLLVTPNAVHTQFCRICSRLGVRNRAAAVLVAVQHGWVTLPKAAGPWPRTERDA